MKAKNIFPVYIVLLVAVQFNAFSTLYASPPENVELEEAKQLFNEGRFGDAINLLDRLIVTETISRDDYLEANEYLAIAHISLGEDRDAAAVFSQVIGRYPDYKPSEQWWPHQKFMDSYYRTAKETGQLEGASGAGPGIKTIAIMDFENNAIDEPDKYSNLGPALSKILISDFSVVSDLKVVERERVRFLIDELELTAKKVDGQNVVDPESAPRLGKLLGAHSFVFGSFVKIGNSFRIDARLVRTETGEIFKTASVEGKPDKIIELAKELTLKITKELDVAIKSMEKKQLDSYAKDDIPIEAVALFGDAMSNANQEDYRNAVVKLEEALAIAPRFEKARSMMEVLRPLAL